MTSRWPRFLHGICANTRLLRQHQGKGRTNATHAGRHTTSYTVAFTYGRTSDNRFEVNERLVNKVARALEERDLATEFEIIHKEARAGHRCANADFPLAQYDIQTNPALLHYFPDKLTLLDPGIMLNKFLISEERILRCGKSSPEFWATASENGGGCELSALTSFTNLKTREMFWDTEKNYLYKLTTRSSTG